MPKLFQINVTANHGSTGKIAEQIGQLVIDKGWQSTIAYGRCPRESQSELIRVGSDWDMKLHALSTRIFDNTGLASSGATRKLVKQIEDYNPDIIHLHNIHGYYVNYKILFDFLKRYKKPVVWTLHDCWTFTGHCAHFSFPKCEKWKSGCGKCTNINKYPSSWGYDRSAQNFIDKKNAFGGVEKLTLVPVSTWLDNLLKQSFLKDYETHTIHNGIDLSVFKPYEKINDGCFRIIGVSNVWDTQKGLQDIIKLREILPSEHEIILVGLSSKQIGLLPQGIKGITRTDNQEQLAKLYATSDVLINPTYEDTFPTVNLEAMACGTPVITYRTGGSPEAIDEKTGVVIEQGDIEAMCNAIMKLKAEPLSANNCRERAVQNFNKDICFEKYINLYNSLLNHNGE